MQDKINKQETLEEAAKNYADIPLHRDIDTEERYFNFNVRDYDSFIEGAKWQQEQDKKMYSNQIDMLWLKYRAYTNNEDAWCFKEWLLEQFKNK
jgi:hypothetical protein